MQESCAMSLHGKFESIVGINRVHLHEILPEISNFAGYVANEQIESVVTKAKAGRGVS